MSKKNVLKWIEEIKYKCWNASEYPTYFGAYEYNYVNKRLNKIIKELMKHEAITSTQ